MKTFFTTKQAAEITGCTLRQLQYWREKEAIVPVVEATGSGRSVYYSRANLVQLALMSYWLSLGLSFEVAHKILKMLEDKEPNFSNFEQISRPLEKLDGSRGDPNSKSPSTFRFMLLLDSVEQASDSGDALKLKIVDFDLEQAIALLKAGQAVVPVWLDAIYQRLLNTGRV